MNYQNMMIVRLLFFLAATTHALSEAPCIERERHALLRFKEGITFDGDNFLESWTSSRKDCCAWRGIRCDNLTYHILMIDLHPNFTYYDGGGYSWQPLGGEISSSIVELQHLRLLNLSFNDFTTIPKFIGALKSLTFLDLAENPLAGTIPSELGNLTNLRFLGLDSASGGLTANNLEWISHLPNLKIFRLSDANLTNSLDWFQSIKTAPALSSLELTLCDFPVQVDISSLYHINSSNSLTTLDVSSGTMYPTTVPSLLNLSHNLVSLTIQWGLIGGPLPDSFGDMNSLRHIILQGNEFEGPIPKSIGNHCYLQHLDLSDNSFDGTLHEFLENRAASCLEDSLETLDMARNKLTGQVPDLSKMSSLREFDVSYNKLNGSLPQSIGQLHNLEILRLSSNSLSGVVSEVYFHKLSNLKELDLSSNSLTLSFNSSWVPPFQLTFLSLSSCKLGPQFPSWLHNQLNLSHLDISNSGISGAIPDWFSKQSSKLEYLDLSSNLLNSTLPHFPLVSDNSPRLNFSSNQFHGSVPPSLSNASELYLSNNKFNGIRSFLCNQKDGATSVLDLSNNLLSGRLPNCRWNFKNLVVLILENNELSGMIPGSITSLHRLANLNLRNNSFSGRLPSQLKHCTDLKVLDVGENNLIGKIPSWIGEILDQLVLLSLKSNRFNGTFPSTICKLQFLQIMDLSINNISGAIPSCIDNFTSMVQYKDRGEDIGSISVNLPFGKSSWNYYFDTTAFITWKGIEYKYKEILGLLRVIDLSSNRLTGEIPKQLENLSELVQLNLSRNNLSGAIPTKIGKLSKLESLDLSHNDLSGRIPVSLAQISTLDYLDLSNNQLSGRIPTSTQLQSFNASAYIGNLQLCGQPLTLTCPGDETSEVPLNSDESYDDDDDSGEWYDMSWLRMGIGVGFAVGFCGVCGNLWLITTFRLAYFQFMDHMGDWLYVLIVVKWAMLKRRFSS